MLFSKLALLTCAFDLMIVAVLDLAVFVAGYFGWIRMIGAKGWPLFLWFGTIWLISFHFALRIVTAGIRAKFHH